MFILNHDSATLLLLFFQDQGEAHKPELFDLDSVTKPCTVCYSSHGDIRKAMSPKLEVNKKQNNSKTLDIIVEHM